MMDNRYVITIYVTAEEEQAIVDLYKVRRWTFHKLGTHSFGVPPEDSAFVSKTIAIVRKQIEMQEQDGLADKDSDTDSTVSVDSESTISVEEKVSPDELEQTDNADSYQTYQQQQLSSMPVNTVTELTDIKGGKSSKAIINTVPVNCHLNITSPGSHPNPVEAGSEFSMNQVNFCDKGEVLVESSENSTQLTQTDTLIGDIGVVKNETLKGNTNDTFSEVEFEGRCDICKLELNNMNLRKGHQLLDCRTILTEAKTEDGFFCQVCSVTIFSSHSFIRHKLNGICNMSKCLECGVEFSNSSMYQEHENVVCMEMLQAAKRDNGYCCKRCHTTFKTTATYMAHKLNRSCYGLLLHCEFCGKTYPSRRKHCFSQHLKRHLNDRQFKCQLCGKAYLNKDTLRDHMRMHTGERPYKCHYCSQEFTTGSHRRNHEMLKHMDVPRSHVCDKCGAAFQFRARLTHHMDIVHSDQRNFPCEHCNKKFKSNSLKKQHMKIHATVKNHVCEICGKGYIMEKYLRTHIGRHLGKHKHFCEECGKGFFTKQPLLIHKRIHTGVKPFSCTLCDYRCNCRGNMNKHVKTVHNKEQPGEFIKKVDT